MFTLRCTKKLLGRLGISRPTSAEAVAVAPSTRLGDWHGNALYRTDLELVLLVNDRSLLPVLVSARPGELIVSTFAEALGTLLARLGVESERISAELAEMAEVRIAPSASRQILGTMTDFDRMLDSYIEGGTTLVDLALRLAEAPCSPIGMRSPMDVAVELLAAGE